MVNFGQQVTPPTKGNSSLEAAFAQAMTVNSLESNDDPGGDVTKNNWVCCDVCKDQHVDKKSTMRIRSALEYMCIHVNLFAKTPEGISIKNRNPLRIPSILDLTQHVKPVGDHPPAPLRYKLINVVYRTGNGLDGGHYVAGVTGPSSATDSDPANPPNQFCANDQFVEPWTNTAGTNVLTANPATHEKFDRAKYDPYLLFYEYIPYSTVNAKGKRDITLPAELEDEPSIAERIREKRLVRKVRGEHTTRKKREAEGGAKSVEGSSSES